MRLGNTFLVFRPHGQGAIDVKHPTEDLMEEIVLTDDEPFILHPGEFVLGVTHEKVGLADDVVGQLNGKSSLGRLGIIVHATAGFIDPGNTLKPTLELSNIGRLPVKLYPMMPVCQMAFIRLGTPAERPYGHPERNSKYFGADRPEASKMHKNF
jgi:dCTP deaminase